MAADTAPITLADLQWKIPQTQRDLQKWTRSSRITPDQSDPDPRRPPTTQNSSLDQWPPRQLVMNTGLQPNRVAPPHGAAITQPRHRAIATITARRHRSTREATRPMGKLDQWAPRHNNSTSMQHYRDPRTQRPTSRTHRSSTRSTVDASTTILSTTTPASGRGHHHLDQWPPRHRSQATSTITETRLAP